ncbi:hypothetical protein P154DRAFT_529644 [Amniculicola lignicola CBS 123094]|uniref:Uncharacterized protein n=1 Tax=Amniculicola lignicola CBS 123094 TaxID=1392246 RepID=A0A6A5WZL0_9PLEO|nr:hypothetical protein P154DRAFT_529644 [Amniculicola lignicola CBS 123094]
MSNTPPPTHHPHPPFHIDLSNLTYTAPQTHAHMTIPPFTRSKSGSKGESNPTTPTSPPLPPHLSKTHTTGSMKPPGLKRRWSWVHRPSFIGHLPDMHLGREQKVEEAAVDEERDEEEERLLRKEKGKGKEKMKAEEQEAQPEHRETRVEGEAVEEVEEEEEGVDGGPICREAEIDKWKCCQMRDLHGEKEGERERRKHAAFIGGGRRKSFRW